jgi:hypothetical protein
LSERRPEHPASPIRHVLLGVKIAYFTLAFFFGVGIGLCGFYRAGDALYAFLDSGKGWGKVLGWTGLTYLRFGLGVGVIACALSVCAAC